MGFPETFKALADPIRRNILILLKQGKMSAGEIGEYFEMTGATISYHLSLLNDNDDHLFVANGLSVGFVSTGASGNPNTL